MKTDVQHHKSLEQMVSFETFQSRFEKLKEDSYLNFIIENVLEERKKTGSLMFVHEHDHITKLGEDWNHFVSIRDRRVSEYILFGMADRVRALFLYEKNRVAIHWSTYHDWADKLWHLYVKFAELLFNLSSHHLYDLITPQSKCFCCDQHHIVKIPW